MTTEIQATCGGCMFRVLSGVLPRQTVLQFAREHDGEGHLVAVWDSPPRDAPREVPRELWLS